MLIKNKTFQFQMSDCYKKENGICPIKENDRTINCRCNEIREELENTNYVQHSNVPEIIHYRRCNHYSCNDGQHRICIAGKTGNGHEWDAVISSRIITRQGKTKMVKTAGCPYCRNPPKRILVGFNDLETWCKNA